MNLYKQATIDKLIGETLRKVICGELPIHEMQTFFAGIVTALGASNLLDTQEMDSLKSDFEQTYGNFKLSDERSFTFLFEIAYSEDMKYKMLHYYGSQYLCREKLQCDFYTNYIVRYDSVMDGLCSFFIASFLPNDVSCRTIEYTSIQKSDEVMMKFFSAKEQPPVVLTSFSADLSYAELPPGRYISQIIAPENIENYFVELSGISEKTEKELAQEEDVMEK